MEKQDPGIILINTQPLIKIITIFRVHRQAYCLAKGFIRMKMGGYSLPVWISSD